MEKKFPEQNITPEYSDAFDSVSTLDSESIAVHKNRLEDKIGEIDERITNKKLALESATTDRDREILSIEIKQLEMVLNSSKNSLSGINDGIKKQTVE